MADALVLLPDRLVMGEKRDLPLSKSLLIMFSMSYTTSRQTSEENTFRKKTIPLMWKRMQFQIITHCEKTQQCVEKILQAFILKRENKMQKGICLTIEVAALL